jgi:hypothetical protein
MNSISFTFKAFKSLYLAMPAPMIAPAAAYVVDIGSP